MNQPVGSCLPYIAELAAAHAMESQDTSVVESTELPACQDHEIPDNGEIFQHETEMSDGSAMVIDALHASNAIADEFQGASWTFGKGKTFLEEFNTDPHAAARGDNLYYPFASKEEWELASFLLLSGLSMASITKFLSLKLVCNFLLFLSCPKIHYELWMLGAVTSPLILHCKGLALPG